MNKINKKSKIILAILFFGPLLFYLSLLTGTHQYTKLPILTPQVENISTFKQAGEISFTDRVSVVAFFGKDLLLHKTNALNLNEKIYKNFYGYPDFQMVIVLPQGSEIEAAQLKKEIGTFANIEKWYFVFLQDSEIEALFSSLGTPYSLDTKFYSPYAFIIDKQLNLRGRNDEKEDENGLLFGYNAETVAVIHQKMVDDLKVLMSEYRLALKRTKDKG
jgi:hypothetical protein